MDKQARKTALTCAIVALLAAASTPVARAQRVANAIVAADGSGDFRTIQEAVNAVPQTTSESNRWVILIKPGTYREIVYVQREKQFVTLAGEDPVRTVITYNLSATNLGSDGLFINSTAPTPLLPGRKEMVERLRSLGIESTIITIPDTPHPFWLVQPWFDRTLDLTEEFLRRQLKS